MSIARLLLIPAVAALAASPAQASPELLKKARCNACHTVDTKRVGPPLREIAARYQGQEGAAQKLFAKVREGGAGNWGDVPMLPNGDDKISDADLQSLIAWILEGAK